VIEIIASPKVAQWVAARIEGFGDASRFGEHSAIGIGIDGTPVAGFVFNDLREEKHGNDVRVSAAAIPGAKWARPAVLHRLFSYVFNELDCVRVTFVIREGNTHAEKISKHLGFRREGVTRRGWDGRTNALIYGLLKTECRYL
jgi:RimJ/RimL family protein N-acetyltransferase